MSLNTSSLPKALIFSLVFFTLVSVNSCSDCYKEPNEDKENFFAVELRKLLTSVANMIAPLPEEYNFDVPEMIKNAGYPVEVHKVTTEDGYILTFHRIPGKQNSTAVFLQHGAICSSADFLLLGKNKALGYLLADANYDIWMGNLRGSFYSKCHKSLSTKDPKYWDFSFDEIGKYDFPASIEYITKIKKGKIFFIGHSMAVTAFFLMSSFRPNMNQHIKAAFHFSPPVFMNNTPTIFKVLAPFTNILKYLVTFIEGPELVPLTKNKILMFRYICSLSIVEEKICGFFLQAFYGFDPRHANNTLIPHLLSINPAGMSTKTLAHYGQLVDSGHFREYDYYNSNKIGYSTLSPDYNLSAVTIPIGLMYGGHDAFVGIPDVRRLVKKLPNVIMDEEIPEFNHADFLIGIDVETLAYKKVISEMEKWR